MHQRILIALAISAIITGTHAAPQRRGVKPSPAQVAETAYNAGTHMGRVGAALSACTEYEMLEPAWLAMKAHAANNENAFGQGMTFGINDFKGALENQGLFVACTMAYTLYGPAGVNVPNMLQKVGPVPVQREEAMR